MSLATAVSHSSGRIWTIARNVFLEIVRDRILYVVGVFGIIMVMAITLIPEVAAGTEDKIILDTGLAAINILSLFVVVFIGTGLISVQRDCDFFGGDGRADCFADGFDVGAAIAERYSLSAGADVAIGSFYVFGDGAADCGGDDVWRGDQYGAGNADDVGYFCGGP